MDVPNQCYLYLLVNILELVSISWRPEKCDVFSFSHNLDVNDDNTHLLSSYSK
ncbi:hypothetical protein M422DRAFT_33341 [Sphaerobolus stellatus SS14]|uniref:Uncharacterized protein n=1 Tax=Sphaerobolus stellatus (strain SS14) TaxID=990650 RepID=A0A0C9VA43_SPHS4|nr:hypothetical protein M422DRAFT_33341 [Sphaerobolus stellatus SS14]